VAARGPRPEAADMISCNSRGKPAKACYKQGVGVEASPRVRGTRPKPLGKSAKTGRSLERLSRAVPQSPPRKPKGLGWWKWAVAAEKSHTRAASPVPIGVTRWDSEALGFSYDLPGVRLCWRGGSTTRRTKSRKDGSVIW
jgi:hypothetical protein